MKTIALIAPSSNAKSLTRENACELCDSFAQSGYQVSLGRHIFDSTRYLAGTDSDRVADIMQAFTDDAVDAVMTVRGGYGSPRLLDKLDYNVLAQNPKPFYTISDGTALQTALYTRAGITGYSGVQALFWSDPAYKDVVRSALRTLRGEALTIPVGGVLVSGTAQGIAVGGNLAVFEALSGTPYFPDMTGKILVLEDVNEPPYKIDRMLTHLRLTGVFQKIAGLVLGDFSSCLSKNPTDGTVEDVFNDFFSDFDKPVVQINYGHLNAQTVVPVGKVVRIETENRIIREVS